MKLIKRKKEKTKEKDNKKVDIETKETDKKTLKKGSRDIKDFLLSFFGRDLLLKDENKYIGLYSKWFALILSIGWLDNLYMKGDGSAYIDLQ